MRYQRPRLALYLRVFAFRFSSAFIRASRSGEAFLRSSMAGIVHVIARQLRDYSHWLGSLSVGSRDFHERREPPAGDVMIRIVA